ncbi:MAG: protein-ADP-ribose hydrolase [Clostridia bacterium]|nr:protein-ADP-ribose hydrolase [Clostridia bacterium]
MTQSEKRIFLINRLIAEQDEYSHISIPTNEVEQKKLLRSLMNVRIPKPVSDEFLKIQDEYLHAEIAEKGITDISDLEPIKDGIYLWQGDITTLKCGAIVNAANSRMLGCFVPCHKCIDNAIHTYAGIQLREECEQLMQTQGYDEPTGKAKITKAYNLPCDYIIHTVGPIVSGKLTKTDCELLTSCYKTCLETAERNNIKSIAFCCISTGEFHFPNDKAAEIAVNTVNEYLKNSDIEKVIFNVFKNIDYEIYREFLGTNK